MCWRQPVRSLRLRTARSRSSWAKGFHPVIIGKRDHVEVRGLTEDLVEFDVVLNDDDVAQLPERRRFGIAAQTTQPIDKVRRLVGLIRRRFPNSEVRFVDTVCQPTKQRQNAALELAQKCDMVVVSARAQQQHPRTRRGRVASIVRACITFKRPPTCIQTGFAATTPSASRRGLRRRMR